MFQNLSAGDSGGVFILNDTGFKIKDVYLRQITNSSHNLKSISDTEASFLDLHLFISNGFVKTKIFDKRDDFEFVIMNFSFLDGSSFDILWCLYFSTYSFCSSFQSCG